MELILSVTDWILAAGDRGASAAKTRVGRVECGLSATEWMLAAMKRPLFNPPRTVNKTEAVAGGTELILSISKRGLPATNPGGANLSYRAFAFMPGYSGTLQTKPKRFPRDPSRGGSHGPTLTWPWVLLKVWIAEDLFVGRICQPGRFPSLQRRGGRDVKKMLRSFL